nr:MAG TPA: hypothetical protein [Caudoviricetes sp.]
MPPSCFNPSVTTSIIIPPLLSISHKPYRHYSTPPRRLSTFA